MHPAIGIALAAILFSATAAQGQRPPPAPVAAGALDLGLYAGAAAPSAWFTTTDAEGEQRWGIGTNPVAGIAGTYWLSPVVGIRLNGALMPSRAPDSGRGDLRGTANNYMFDVNLTLRPWSGIDPASRRSTAYGFLGGGAYTGQIGSVHPPATMLDAGSGRDYACVGIAVLIVAGMCLTDDFTAATVGQVVMGGGFDLVPLTPTMGLFVEGSLRGHASPARKLAEAGTGEERFVVTPGLAVGIRERLASGRAGRTR